MDADLQTMDDKQMDDLDMLEDLLNTLPQVPDELEVRLDNNREILELESPNILFNHGSPPLSDSSPDEPHDGSGIRKFGFDSLLVEEDKEEAPNGDLEPEHTTQYAKCATYGEKVTDFSNYIFENEEEPLIAPANEDNLDVPQTKSADKGPQKRNSSDSAFEFETKKIKIDTENEKYKAENLLIKWVQDRPLLYNMDDPFYQRRALKAQTWNSFIGISGEVAKQKWITLRQEYVAFLRRSESKKGKLRLYFRHEEAMSFYKPFYLKYKKNKNNAEVDDEEIQEFDGNPDSIGLCQSDGPVEIYAIQEPSQNGETLFPGQMLAFQFISRKDMFSHYCKSYPEIRNLDQETQHKFIDELHSRVIKSFPYVLNKLK